MVHQFNAHVRFSEVDLIGLIHNPNYLIYFEEARIDLVKKNNYPHKQLLKDGITVPIYEYKVQILKPLEYDEEIVVNVTVGFIKNFSFQVKYVIEKKSNIIVCKGYTNHTVLSIKTKEFQAMPDKFISIISKYIEKK